NTHTHTHTHTHTYTHTHTFFHLSPIKINRGDIQTLTLSNLLVPLVFVIYNCNGRCILTERNRISTNKSRKLHFITFMTLFVFDAENRYLNPQANSKNSGSQ